MKLSVWLCDTALWYSITNSSNSRDPTFDDRDDNVKQEPASSADAKPAAAKRERENDDAGDKDAKKVKN